MNIKSIKSKSYGTKVFLVTLVLSLFLIAIHLFQYVFSLTGFGIHPRSLSFTGFFMAPLIHSSWTHLWSNLSVLIIAFPLTMVLFKDRFISILAIIWVVTFFWVWVFGIPFSSHVGASGIIYGLIFFNLFAGFFIRSYLAILASVLILFLFSSLVLGVLNIEAGVSFASHLGGAVAGVVAALFFKTKNLKTNI